MVTFTGIVTIVANVALVVITWLYVRLTKKLVAVQTDPFVIICDVKLADKVSIKIENIGKGPAYDIRFERDDKVSADVWKEFLNHTSDNRLIQKTAIGQGMPVLFPGGCHLYPWHNDDTELILTLSGGLPVICRFNKAPKGNSQEKADFTVHCFLDLVRS